MTARIFALLLTRCHSVLLKKNSLFFKTGPPTEYPNWLRVYFPFGIPLALLSKSFEVSAETRLNSYRVPCRLLVPDLVTTLTTPPEALPYSAVKLLVVTLNSCTASRGTD